MMKNLRLIFSSLVLALFANGSFAQTLFLVQEPSNLSGTYDFTDSFTADGWGADLTSNYVQAEAAWAYDDGTYIDPQSGAAGDSACCGPAINVSEITGKIAFIYRGACNFSLKAYQAQAAGAVGCVIVNNEPGNLVNMLGGDSASAITIPTVFVSDITGATLRDSIEAGGVEIFIGNPNGVFTNNIGAYRQNIAVANSRSFPVDFAQTNTAFTYPVGAWVFNFGSADAENVFLQAVIDRDGTEIYNETSTSGATILPGDSLFVMLPDYNENGYQAGFYTVTYTMVADATDELPSDNELTTNFWINNAGVYSKSRVDPNDGPQGAGGLRPADGTEYEWCIAMQSENASALQITGLTFNTVTNDIDLTGEAVQLSVYEWNDPITTSVTFDDLFELTDNEFYDYGADLQGEFVTHEFAEPIDLEDELKYLACVTIFIDDHFLGVDGSIDYNVAYETYPNEVFFPLHDLDTDSWFPGGFGTDNVPAIIVNLAEPNGVAEDIEQLNVVPYPNPTVDAITIPLGLDVSGDVIVDIYDTKGGLVMSETICQVNSTLRLDVSRLSSGLHTFNLRFEDSSHTSFQVMITK